MISRVGGGDASHGSHRAVAPVVCSQTGYAVADIYVGLPADAQPLAAVESRPTIWQKHFWMFLVVLILLLIALITGLLCCTFWYCCRKNKKDKQPPPVTARADF